jgi:hypothetical protein
MAQTNGPVDGFGRKKTKPVTGKYLGNQPMNIEKIRKFAAVPAIALALSGAPVSAQDASPEGWQWGAELYFWGASLGGSTTSGGDVDIGIDTIIDDLKFGAMGTVAARKGDWGLFADMIYLDLGDSASTTANIGPISFPVSASIDLKGFITTAGVGYRVYDQGGTSIDATGGIRYLWLDATLDVSVPSITRSVREEESGSNWDAVVGFRGKTDLNDKWYLTYYADIGAGDSDLTWQALAAVNYRLSRVDLSLGYRYLEWDFDDFGPFNDLDLSGAFAGVKIPF